MIKIEIVAVIIYKKVLNLGRNEETKCWIKRSLFRPIFICHVSLILLCQKATAMFKRLLFGIFCLLKYNVIHTLLQCRAPPIWN